MKLTCNICNSRFTSNLGKIEGYRANTYFDVIVCDTCEVSFVYPCQSDNKIYEVIYKNIEIIPGYSRYFQYARQILKEKNPLNYLTNLDDCYWAIIQSVFLENGNKKHHKILEVGCGQGYLTYALVQAGFNAIGLDISETAIALAKKRYGEYYFCEEVSAYCNRTNERPSLIILSEVIEHVPDPFVLLKEFLKYLQPDGAIIVTTPNKNVCLTSAVWDTELPTVHLWWLTEKGLEAIGKRLSCKTVFTDFSEFYSTNLRFTTSAKIRAQQRTPILDAEYQVIAQDSQHLSAFSSFVKLIFKRLLPNKILRKLQLKNTNRQGLSQITALNPASLCVIYKLAKP